LAAVAALGCSGSVTEGTKGQPSGDGGVEAEAGPGQETGTGADTSPIDTGTDVDTGGYGACTTADECGWGEIDHEILSAADCICLYGCPGYPLNRTTIERRRAQYEALCDPKVDGQGHPCGIDDCIEPPPIACVGGQCALPTTSACTPPACFADLPSSCLSMPYDNCGTVNGQCTCIVSCWNMPDGGTNCGHPCQLTDEGTPYCAAGL